MLTLALLFMFGFTALAAQVIMWQSQDISVAIVSETEEGSKEVTISVKNTAGSKLLFYENEEMTGKIEYLSDEGWIEYCDVYYTPDNATAISLLYGGTFAELEPGENWNVIVPEDKVAAMQNGTYRIKMTYITEDNYKKYLDSKFNDRVFSEDESEEGFENEESFEEYDEFSEEIISEAGDEVLDNAEENNDDFFTDFLPLFGTEVKEEPEIIEEEEEFLAASKSEVFIKTFEYEVPEDFVSEISIEDNDIDTFERRRNIGDNTSQDQLY